MLTFRVNLQKQAWIFLSYSHDTETKKTYPKKLNNVPDAVGNFVFHSQYIGLKCLHQTDRQAALHVSSLFTKPYVGDPAPISVSFRFL